MNKAVTLQQLAGRRRLTMQDHGQQSTKNYVLTALR